MRFSKPRFRSPKFKQGDLPLLEGLTSSPVRARLLRLLFREPEVSIGLQDAAKRLGVPSPMLRREAELLEQLGVIALGKGKTRRMQVLTSFPFAGELRTMSVRSFPASRPELLQILGRAGKLRLVVLSGVFLNEERSPVDIFVVANRLSETQLDRAAEKIEQMVGSELKWAGMNTKEFLYRWGMFDRFLRDIFSRPHERLLEKIKF